MWFLVASLLFVQPPSPYGSMICTYLDTVQCYSVADYNNKHMLVFHTGTECAQAITQSVMPVGDAQLSCLYVEGTK